MAGNTAYMLSHIIAGRSKQCACDSTGREWKLPLGLSRTLLHVPVSFADFNLYPFAVINHNC